MAYAYDVHALQVGAPPETPVVFGPGAFKKRTSRESGVRGGMSISHTGMSSRERATCEF